MPVGFTASSSSALTRVRSSISRWTRYSLLGVSRLEGERVLSDGRDGRPPVSPVFLGCAAVLDDRSGLPRLPPQFGGAPPRFRAFGPFPPNPWFATNPGHDFSCPVPSCDRSEKPRATEACERPPRLARRWLGMTPPSRSRVQWDWGVAPNAGRSPAEQTHESWTARSIRD
jgi:hypothetical protein